MKRYERMTKEEMIEYVRSCYTVTEKPGEITLGKFIADQLEREIQLVPRYATIKNDEDMDRVMTDFDTFCAGRDGCETCRIYEKCKDTMSYVCFAEYLKEQVEEERT